VLAQAAGLAVSSAAVAEAEAAQRAATAAAAEAAAAESAAAAAAAVAAEAEAPPLADTLLAPSGVVDAPASQAAAGGGALTERNLEKEDEQAREGIYSGTAERRAKPPAALLPQQAQLHPAPTDSGQPKTKVAAAVAMAGDALPTKCGEDRGADARGAAPWAGSEPLAAAVVVEGDSVEALAARAAAEAERALTLRAGTLPRMEEAAAAAAAAAHWHARMRAVATEQMDDSAAEAALAEAEAAAARVSATTQGL